MTQTSVPLWRLSRDSRPTVLVVAAEPLFRHGIATVLDRHLTVAGAAATAQDARRILARSVPCLSVLALDPSLRDAGGDEACAQLIAALASTAVLVLLRTTDTHRVRAALRSGARGVCHTSISPEQLCAALAHVERGNCHVDPCFLPALASAPDSAPDAAVHPALVPAPARTPDGLLCAAPTGREPVAPSDEPAALRSLTRRVPEIIQLVAAGHTSKDIASELGTKAGYVDKLLAEAARRQGAASRSQLVVLSLGPRQDT